MQNESSERFKFLLPSQHRGSSYVPPDVVQGSLIKSMIEENALCMKLVEEAFSQELPSCQTVSWYLFNNPVGSVLQGFQRPMCGLVALHMAAQLLKKLNSSAPNLLLPEIFNKALDMKITKQGEMFSAYEMATLASTLYACKAEVHDGNLFKNRVEILQHILHGHPVLVPYDNDRNFEPCLRNGHKAHWAILTGFVMSTAHVLEENQFFKRLSSNVWRIPENFVKLFSELIAAKSDLQSLYMYTKQGKSAKNRLWSMESISQSNSNLHERDPSRDWSSFHCPYSLSDTLRQKYVILHF